MNMQFHCKLPIPMEVKKQYPASEQVLQIVDSYTQQIKDILSGKDERLLLIVGPCSADNSEALLQYCYKLKQVSDKVKSKILIILDIEPSTGVLCQNNESCFSSRN